LASAWAAFKDRAPFSVRQIARHVWGRVPYGLRYGAVFRETRALLAESQWWSRDRLVAYQLERLRELIRYVHRTVPYYRNVLDERGIDPAEFAGIEDLRRLPFLTKDVLRESMERVVPEDIPRSRLSRVTTGGTTGEPLPVYSLRRVTEAREWAFIWRGWGWAGYRPGMRKVVVRGNVPRRRRRCTQPRWEHNPSDRSLVLSAYQMTQDTLPEYVDMIRQFRPHVIQAYPSAIWPLARFLEAQGTKLQGVRCVLTCSETVYPGQRELAEELLGATIFDHYGTTERSVLVMQCEKLRYHVIPEYGVLELIGSDGEPVVTPGSTGEIVATGFINPAMPLVRYRTGDVAILGSAGCSCGRNYEVLERIDGRLQDHFVASDGTLLPAMISDEPLWDLPDPIETYQYIQDEPGRLLLNVAAAGELSDRSIERIRQEFDKRYPGFGLRICEVDHIPRTVRGKFRYVVQHLPLDGLEFGHRR